MGDVASAEALRLRDLMGGGGLLTCVLDVVSPSVVSVPVAASCKFDVFIEVFWTDPSVDLWVDVDALAPFSCRLFALTVVFSLLVCWTSVVGSPFIFVLSVGGLAMSRKGESWVPVRCKVSSWVPSGDVAWVDGAAWVLGLICVGWQLICLGSVCCWALVLPSGWLSALWFPCAVVGVGSAVWSSLSSSNPISSTVMNWDSVRSSSIPDMSWSVP